MNRVLLLLLSVLTINVYGKIFPTEILKSPAPPNVISQNEPPDKPHVHPSLPTPALMDTVPPELQCPASETIILQTQGRCDTILNYTVTATDDQGIAIPIQLSGPASGSVFPIGISTCVFLATDLAGNTATCSFSFDVEDNGIVSIQCADLVTVVLDANCTKDLLPQEVLEGGPYGCWDRYFIEVDKTAPFGTGPWFPASFNASDIGKTYQARVTDSKTIVKCWGNVKIEDKTGPVINCIDVTVSCAQNDISPEFLRDSLSLANAIPVATDACGGISFMGHLDSTTPLDCDSPFTKIINREWHANDLSGNTSTCIQRIKMHRHTPDEMQVPADITISCPDTATAPALTGLPYVIYQGRRYELEDNSICDISAFYTDNVLKLPCGDKRVLRNWEFFDFCSSTTVGPFAQNIYLLDQTGPTLACPPALFVSVNADTCHGSVNLPDVVLNDVCSQLKSYQAFWEDNGLAKTILGTLADFPGSDPNSHDTLGVLGNAIFPVGVTEVSLVAEDSCGNIGDCNFTLTVADMEPPVAHCPSVVTLYLETDGLLALPSDAFDEGSTDACTALSFKARLLDETPCLYDTILGDTLRFCCLNLQDSLDALLRVYDIPVPAGNVTNAFGAGHFTDCALKIAVEDPNPPSCTAPPNITVNCQDFDPTLNVYGLITSNSCSVDSMTIDVDYAQFDTLCNKGVLTRIFKVFDHAGNIGGCAQAITVNYLQDYYTKFPDDVIVTACDGSSDFGQPLFFGQDCENFKVEYTDQLFTIVPDACYKIERTWKITNSCTYDPGKPLIIIPNPTPSPISNHASNLPGPVVSACNTLGLWAPTIVKINPTDPIPTNYCTFFSDTANGYEYKQIIRIVDIQQPTGNYTIPACGNQDWKSGNNPQFWNETFWNDPVYNTHDLCEEPTALSITATDACAGPNISIDFLLYLDLDGDNITETVVDSKALGVAGLGWNNVLFNNYNTPNFVGGSPSTFDERPVMADQKVGFAKEEVISGVNKTAYVRWNTLADPNTFFPPELPHGAHKIKWFITDNCGNEKMYEYPFTVRDCKTPTVVCLAPLSVNILPSGSITMYASDFLQYAEDNCTPADQIKLSIRKCGTGSSAPLDNNGDPIPTVTFNCTEIGSRCVEIWGIDKSGNADFCEASITILDSQNYCQNPGNSTTHRVITELDEGISDVNISLDGTCNFCPPPTTVIQTDSLGYYTLDLNNFPITISINAEKDDNPLNGVTTYDLVLISKHILGIEALNSPYKMISADANKSGSITTFDIVELRKLILGIYTDLPNNTSWRFVDSNFVFPNPLNPFQTSFPEQIPAINPKPYNFIGMKIGDVNNTAVPNAQALASERWDGILFLDAEDRTVKEGEIFELKFHSSELMEGCQFTFETDGLEILDILPGQNMSKDNFALFPSKSLFTMAWETGGRPSFTLRLKAKRAGRISELMRLTDQITRSEAYPAAQSADQKPLRAQLALRFGNPDVAFALFQNQPNPFAGKTDISFQLPEAGPASLTVFDENGKMVWSKSGEWPAGLNTVRAVLSKRNASGVLYCKLETPAQSAVIKMVMLR